MLSLASLLNPAPPGPPSTARFRPGPAISSPATPPCPVENLPGFVMERLHYPQPKTARESAAFAKSRAKGSITFPPFEDLDEASLREVTRFQVYPLGRIRQNCRHIPYNSGKKDFYEKTGRESFEVFQYSFKLPGEDYEYVVMWDYNVGLVRMTPFFKCCKYSKTTPAKMLNMNPGLRDITHSITGGSIMAQGYWMPYACARAVCATFCAHIAGALIPIFGPRFPAECVSPESPDHGRMVIDPALVAECTREADGFRRMYADAAAAAAATACSPGGKAAPAVRTHRGPYDDDYHRRGGGGHPYYDRGGVAGWSPRPRGTKRGADSLDSAYGTDTDGEAAAYYSAAGGSPPGGARFGFPAPPPGEILPPPTSASSVGSSHSSSSSSAASLPGGVPAAWAAANRASYQHQQLWSEAAYSLPGAGGASAGGLANPWLSAVPRAGEAARIPYPQRTGAVFPARSSAWEPSTALPRRLVVAADAYADAYGHVHDHDHGHDHDHDHDYDASQSGSSPNTASTTSPRADSVAAGAAGAHEDCGPLHPTQHRHQGAPPPPRAPSGAEKNAALMLMHLSVREKGCEGGSAGEGGADEDEGGGREEDRREAESASPGGRQGKARLHRSKRRRATSM